MWDLELGERTRPVSHSPLAPLEGEAWQTGDTDSAAPRPWLRSWRQPLVAGRPHANHPSSRAATQPLQSQPGEHTLNQVGPTLGSGRISQQSARKAGNLREHAVWESPGSCFPNDLGGTRGSE